MTYKTTTINDVSPDSNNNIQLNLSNIDSNISYTSGQGNKKFNYKTGSTSWASENVENVSSTLYFYFRTTQTYNTSSTNKYTTDTSSTMSNYLFRGHGNSYGTKYLKTGVSTVSSSGTSKWAKGITIPDAGTYRLLASMPLETQSSANYVTVRWHDGTSFFGPHAYLTKDGKTNNVLCAVKTITSQTTFYIGVISVSGNNYLGDTREGYCTSINIVKID